MKFSRVLMIVCFLNIFSALGQSNSKPNVLFIFVDDLRPELGAYGNEIIKTPNIDRLASEGSVFKRHYVQVPTCGASRYSILTGTLPQSREHLSNEAIRMFISGEPETNRPETFIHQLRRNGYFTVGIGKVSHYIDGLYGYEESSKNAPPELPYSWDKNLFNAGKWEDGWDAFFAYADGSSRITKERNVKPYENGDVDDDGYPDGLSAKLALEQIDSLANRDEPFFLGIGFFKPHLPFNAPKKYWNMYDEAEISTTASPFIPENVNLASLHDSPEFNRYKLGDEHPVLNRPASEEYAKKVRHAYYAAVSYTDAQIGKLIDKLKSKGLDENTIVVLWGDHGWQLGDHQVWGKHTLFERALKSPLIIKAPSIKKQERDVEEIVSSIDIYPTLMELCEVKMPYETQGRSMVNLMSKKNNDRNWQENAYGYFNNGITVRVPRYRYTKYFRDEQPVIELYDHKNDPNENKNIAAERPKLVNKLDKVLEEGNTGLYSNNN
ncbi:sulfatase [Zunongwangia sp. F363]|uniref:Sulfatase n=1 Tax=Autumnicola tepida TaxID=3075595 RepID=A0ABU3C8Y1_9FLAO|nr:sulfatase [Zunongwangia sp. F363]MDT0642791.1 sulfatase [Zunongwangia sp. F363]